MLRKIYNRFRDIPYSVNASEIVDIPRGKLIRGILLKLTGVFTIGGVDGAGTVVQDNPWTLIKRIQVIVDGSQIVKDMDGVGYRHWNQSFDLKSHGFPQTVCVAATADTYPLLAYIWIPFVMPGTRVPIDTLFDSRLTDTLQLRIDWGDVESIVAGGGLTKELTDVKITPVSVETTQPASRVFSLLKEFIIEKTVDSVTTEYPIDIPRGQWSYRAFMMRCVSDDVRSDGIITEFSKVSQSSFFHFNAIPAPVFRELSEMEEMALGQATGIYIWDAIEDGMLTGAVPTGRLSDYRFKLDVLHPGTTDKIFLYCRQVIPADVKLAKALATESKFRQTSII